MDNLQKQKLDISALENAFDSLDQTLLTLSNEDWFNAQTEIVQDTLIAGAIQKFEFVYELAIKMLKRQLNLIVSNDIDVDSSDFRDVLRMAAQFGLIDNPNQWVEFRKMRNITSHTYDQTKAEKVYSEMADFLQSSRFLVEQLRLRQGPSL
ncbi:nucleotidyltransferase substrate binding protein [Lonepinella sp. BR2271]|uniref:nucleotidyltransferase substrate binding protein n=1 Tax=Lonepinella sp. BR2271 TaxID=3434550 RepID=UPI003F6DFFE1